MTTNYHYYYYYYYYYYCMLLLEFFPLGYLIMDPFGGSLEGKQGGSTYPYRGSKKHT